MTSFSSKNQSSVKQVVAEELMKLLLPYKERVDSDIAALIPKMGEKTALRDACEYALLTPGKRFRPAIVWMIANALGVNPWVNKAALAVEFFHTSSLIADDLPCMDNDDLRRGRPTVHKAFDEAIALLASFALIAAAFEHTAQAAIDMKQSSVLALQADEVCRIATHESGRVNGILGLIGGQFLDLYPSKVTQELIAEIIAKKTATLFELSFVYGWIFGGGDVNRLDDVKEAALHFGFAFQILDDIDDFEQDTQAGKQINYAVAFGIDEAKRAIHDHTEKFQQKLKDLRLHSQELEKLCAFLSKMSDVYM